MSPSPPSMNYAASSYPSSMNFPSLVSAANAINQAGQAAQAASGVYNATQQKKKRQGQNSGQGTPGPNTTTLNYPGIPAQPQQTAYAQSLPLAAALVAGSSMPTMMQQNAGSLLAAMQYAAASAYPGGQA